MQNGKKPNVTNYRDLIVWQRAMDVVVEAYRLTDLLPPSEKYGLVTQIRRAAGSIPANIAEGHGRDHLGDYLRHLSFARGSVMELETHFLYAERPSFISPSELVNLFKLTDEVSRMLAALSSNLQKRMRGSFSLTPQTSHLKPGVAR